MLECITQLYYDLRMALVPSFLLQFVFDLWQKKLGSCPHGTEQKIYYIVIGFWIHIQIDSRGRPNVIKRTYFDSIFSLFLFDQKTKYLVGIHQLSNQNWLGNWNSGQVIDFGYFTKIEHLICKVKPIFSITCLKKIGFTI